MNRDDTSSSEESIIVECDLPEPPEKVWQALTVPELVAAWLLPNDIRPEVGGRFTFQGDRETGGSRVDCEILTVELNRLLRFSWRSGGGEGDVDGRRFDSVVTFALTETATGGTHLRIVHGEFTASLDRPEAPRAAAGTVRPLQGGLRRAGSVTSLMTQPGMRWAA